MVRSGWFWALVGAVAVAGVLCFGLWLDAGGLDRNRSDSADSYATAVIVLAWALVLLLVVGFFEALVKLVRRRGD